MVDVMLRFIGQITVTLAARDRGAAEARLRLFARLLSEGFSDVLFADHRGEVAPYWPVSANGGSLCDSDEIPRFDSFEIHGVAPAGDEQGNYLEPVEESEAELWSLYGHLPGHGLKSIGTFPTREQAEAIYAAITGRPYSHPVWGELKRNSAA
jgi:hypothetical protein